MASALGVDGSDVIFSSSGVGCCHAAAKAVEERAERRRRETYRDRSGTGTSSNGRPNGNDYVSKNRKRGWLARLYRFSFAGDKDYLDPFR
jgi:hypothetical protein